MNSDDIEELRLEWVGLPLELVRALDPVYLDQARSDFDNYVRKTLAASQRHGGRFNPPREFGALYTATDEDTAWAEVAARYAREGIPGLPQEMGILRLLVDTGRFVNFRDDQACASWEIDREVLSRGTLTDQERDICWQVGRAVRSIADFLMSDSAREEGANVPLFPDRDGGEIEVTLRAATRRAPPEYLTQQPQERW